MIDYNTLPYSGKINAYTGNISQLKTEQVEVFKKGLMLANAENNGVIAGIKAVLEQAQAGESPTDIFAGLSKSIKEQKIHLKQLYEELMAHIVQMGGYDE